MMQHVDHDELADVIATGVQFAPWLDCCCRWQYYLPFAPCSAANICGAEHRP